MLVFAGVCRVGRLRRPRLLGGGDTLLYSILGLTATNDDPTIVFWIIHCLDLTQRLM